jgi:6-phosphogluconolactonase
LSVAPQSVSVPIGAGNGTVQVSVQPVNGFNQSVSVNLQGLPSGVTTVPASPFSVSPGTPQTVTVSAARGVSPSAPIVSVLGTSGALSHSGSFGLSVAAAAVYTYVAGNGESPNPSAIAGYAVDPSSGAVTAVTGSPFNLTTDPVTDMVVVSESGGTYLYAVTSGNAVNLLGFRINPANGVLSPIQTINYPAGSGEPRIAAQPFGKYLYAAQVSNCVVAYSIDPATGNLTQASCSAQNPNGPLVVAPSGKFAYGGDSNSTSAPILLTAYSVNQSDGSLTSFQSVVTDNANSLLYTDPQGHALYNLKSGPFLGCGDLSIWGIDPTSGRLSSLNPSAGGPCTPFSMSFDPGSQFVYLTINIYRPYNGVYGYAVDPTTGNLTRLTGPVPGPNPGAAVVEPSQGRFLFVYSSYSGAVIATYAIDATTGALTMVSATSVSSPFSYPVRMVIVAALH